ncbi:sulfite exporter TauE/SafE family protein [soil metagenome]
MSPENPGAATESRAFSTAHGPWDIALVGVLAGLLAGAFGVGGGILVVPGLVLVTTMSQRLAHGTSLGAVLPIAVASSIGYAAHCNVDLPVAVWLAIGAVSGAIVGTRLLHVLPARTLGVMFAAVLLLSAVRLFFPTDADGRATLSAATATGLVAIGLLTGILAGLLGIGGGIVIVPTLILVFGIPPVVAKGTSTLVIVPTSIMGTWRNQRRDNVDLRAAAVIGGAGVVTAAVGSILADRMSDAVSNILFATLLVLVAGWLVVRLGQDHRAESTMNSS